MGGTLHVRPNGTSRPFPCSEPEMQQFLKQIKPTNRREKAKQQTDKLTCCAELSSAASLVFAHPGSFPTENLDICTLQIGALP